MLKQYGVEVVKSNGELNSTYEILTQLAPAWEKMSDAERVSLGETLAGVNQYKVLASVMSNIDAATRAYATAVGSAGSATRENERYMSSLEARLTALRAEFQNLSTKTIQSEFVGSILDAGTALLKFGQSDIGQVIIKVGSLTTGFALLNKSLGGTLVSGLKEVGSGFRTLISSIRTGDMALNGFAATAGAAFSPTSVWILGITAAIGVIYGIVKAIDAATVTTEELYEKADESKSKYESIKAELDGLSVREDLTEEEERRLKILQAQYDIYKEMYQKDAEAAFESKYRGTTTQQEIVGTGQYARGYEIKTQVSREVNQIDVLQQQVNAWIDLQNQIEDTKKSIDEANDPDKILELNDALEDQEDQYLEARKQMVEHVKAMNDYIDAGGKLTDQEDLLYSIMLDMTTAYQESTNAVNDLADATEGLEDEQDPLIEQSKRLAEALFDENGKLTDVGKTAIDSSDSLRELVKQQLEAQKQAAEANYNNLIDQIAQVGIEADLTGEKLKTMFALSGIQTNQALDDRTLSKIYSEARAAGETGGATYGEWKQSYILGLASQEISDIDAKIAQLEEQKDKRSTSYGGGGSSSQKTKTDELKEELKLIDAQVELSANRNEQESNRVELYKVAQEKIKTLEDYYRKQGYSETSAEIVELENLWYDYANKIAEIAGGAASQIAGDIEDATEDIEAQIEAERKRQEEELQTAISNRQDEINAFYDNEISKLEKRNEEVEKAIALEEKLEALEKAKSQRMLVYEDGQFKYQQDYAAIAEAQKSIDEANLAQIYEDEVARLEAKRQEELALAAEEEKIRQRLKALSSDDRLIRDEDYAKALVYLSAQGRETATNDFGDLSYGEGASKLLDLANYAQGESYSGSFMGVEIGKVYNDMIDALGKNTATVGEVKDYISTMVTQDYINKVGMTAIKDTVSVDSVRDTESEIEKLNKRLNEIKAKRGYATGTTSATFGLHMLGEHGRELGLLSNGDGVVPHNITENLMKIGQYSPVELIKSIIGMFKGFVSSIVNQNFGNITLPNVTDFNSFANEMKNFKNYATQNAYNR